jgi:hypothetical protein
MTPTVEIEQIETLSSYFGSLPSKEKTKKIKLTDVFASATEQCVEFILEFEGLLEKGYDYSEIAKIMQNQIGVVVTSTQLRGQYLRGKKTRDTAAGILRPKKTKKGKNQIKNRKNKATNIPNDRAGTENKGDDTGHIDDSTNTQNGMKKALENMAFDE